jgi:hypothetical protein
MKELLSLFLFLLPCLAWAQYPSNGNQKITLGEQTTADGIIWRGVLADTGIITPLSDTSAYIILDTVNHRFYNYNRATNVWSVAGGGTAVTTFSGGTTGLTPSTATSGAVTLGGTLAVANGGTGSATKNFVDLTTTQTVGGAKTFTSAVTATRFNPTANTVTGTGMFAPTSTSLGFSTFGSNRLVIDSLGNFSLGNSASLSSGLSGKFIEFGTPFGDKATLLCNDITDLRMMANVYFSSDFKYVRTGTASIFHLTNGDFKWFTATSGTANNSITFTQPMTLKLDGELQIGSISDRGAFNLQVNGTGVWGEGAYTNGSDANVKENIVDLDSSLNIVNNLKPVIFNYINTSVNNDTKHLGFIAQDVYQTLENKDYLGSIVRSDGDTLSIAYSNIIPLLTKAIQEQQALIKALEQRIINLENK